MPEPIQRVKIAEAKIKGGMGWDEIIKNHTKIMSALETAAKNRLCASVKSIADQTKIDEEDVRNHLKLMTIDKGGMFMDKEKHTFCTHPSMILAIDKLRSFAK